MPFKKGQSGNPVTQFKVGNPGGGRPKKLTHQLEVQLAQKVPGDPKGRSYAQQFIESMVKRAIAKSDVLAKEIFDRIDGKVWRPTEAKESGNRAVQVNLAQERHNSVDYMPGELS